MEYFNCSFASSVFNPHYFPLCQIIFPFRFPIRNDFLFHPWISSFSIQPLDMELRVGRGSEVRDEVPSHGPPICSRKALISFLSPTRVAPLLHATQLIRKRSRWWMWGCVVGEGVCRLEASLFGTQVGPRRVLIVCLTPQPQIEMFVFKLKQMCGRHCVFMWRWSCTVGSVFN